MTEPWASSPSGAESARVGVAASRISVKADKTVIIDDVHCTIAPGSFTALVGPNGAGKSTLLRVLATIEPPASGQVVIGQRDAFTLPRRVRARTIAFVEQEATTELGLTVHAVVGLGRTPHQSLLGGVSPTDLAIVDSALAAVKMSDFEGREFATLSGGERQRILIAKALAQQPRLLLLDEPTNHLDINAQLDVLTVLAGLADQGVTVLAALHDLNLASAFSDHVIVMRSGTVVAAGPTHDTLTAPLISEVYGVAATLVPRPDGGRPVIAFGPPR